MGGLVSGSLPLGPGRSEWPRFLQAGSQKIPAPAPNIPLSASPAASEGLINTKAMGSTSAPSPCQSQDCRDTQSEGTGLFPQDCLEAPDPFGGRLYSSLHLPTPWHSPPLPTLAPCSVLARSPSCGTHGLWLWESSLTPWPAAVIFWSHSLSQLAQFLPFILRAKDWFSKPSGSFMRKFPPFPQGVSHLAMVVAWLVQISSWKYQLFPDSQLFPFSAE